MLSRDDEEAQRFLKPIYRRLETTIAWITAAQNAAAVAETALRSAIDDLGPVRESRETRRAYAKIVGGIVKAKAKLEGQEAEARRELATCDRFMGRASSEPQRNEARTQ